jgi:hypothetical protein
MKSAAEFFKTFGFKGEYNGASCARKISGDRVARVSLSDENGVSLSTQGHYVSLKVEIVFANGSIDRQLFVFDDHLAERSDKRTDYPTGGKGRVFQVIAYCGWEWYIAVPKTVKPLVVAVNKYIKMFEVK